MFSLVFISVLSGCKISFQYFLQCNHSQLNYYDGVKAPEKFNIPNNWQNCFSTVGYNR